MLGDRLIGDDADVEFTELEPEALEAPGSCERVLSRLRKLGRLLTPAPLLLPLPLPPPPPLPLLEASAGATMESLARRLVLPSTELVEECRCGMRLGTSADAGVPGVTKWPTSEEVARV